MSKVKKVKIVLTLLAADKWDSPLSEINLIFGWFRQSGFVSPTTCG